MDLHAVNWDVNTRDEKQPPGIEGFHIPGKAGRLFVLLYTASGEGRHPVVLLTHGIPGHEKNMDLGQALRRMGFSVLMFDYRGCGNSDGTYSFAGSLEDTECVLDYILRDDKGRFDTDNVFIIGFSVGAFAAVHLMARRSDLRAAVLLSPCDVGGGFALVRDRHAHRYTFLNGLAESARWLNGTSTEILVEELEEGYQWMRFLSVAGRLAGRPLLFVSGERDQISPPQIHCRPLVEYLREREENKKYVRWRRFPSDHYFSNVRVKLSVETARFLLRHLTVQGEPPALTEESFRQYIANTCYNTNLSAAADYFHLSVPYFCRRLRQEFGTTFQSALRQMRMEQAAELLRDGSVRIGEVAEEVGYEDPSYFMKVFKEYYGTTPTQFRRRLNHETGNMP